MFDFSKPISIVKHLNTKICSCILYFTEINWVINMDPSFAEAHGILEQVSTLFGQLEKFTGRPEEVSIEDTIKNKLETLNA